MITAFLIFVLVWFIAGAWMTWRVDPVRTKLEWVVMSAAAPYFAIRLIWRELRQ